MICTSKSFDISHEYSWDKSSPWVPLFFLNSVTLTLKFDPFCENFNLANNFELYVLELRFFTWAFLVIKPFRVYHYFLPCDVTLTLEIHPFFENFNVANIFCTVSARFLVFHMSISSDKTFPWVQLFFYPVTLTLEFYSFFENINLQITFKLWVLELWYFTGVFLVIRPFRGYHYFLPCYLDLGDWPIFWKL